MMLQPIVKNTGVNAQERKLAYLSERSFFSLWSYPNIYTNEGYNKNRQGTELCDLLVIFGESAIIFSDKNVCFNAEKAQEVAWRRWYKKAVLGSARQLHGALKAIQNPDLELYLDSKCTQPFPLDLKKIKNYYLVATTNDISPYINSYYRYPNTDKTTLPFFSIMKQVETLS